MLLNDDANNDVAHINMIAMKRSNNDENILDDIKSFTLALRHYNK